MMRRVLVAAAVAVGALGFGATSASAVPVQNGNNCNGAATSAYAGLALGTAISGLAHQGLSADFATGSYDLGGLAYGANCGNNQSRLP